MTLGWDKGEWTFGIPEEAFAHRRPKLGLITLEARAISLSKMHLREKSIVWDIGACSGPVSIESALPSLPLMPSLSVGAGTERKEIPLPPGMDEEGRI